MIDNRKLCAAEQAMEILNRRASTFNVVTHGRILGPLNEEIVRRALDCLQDRHPRLNYRIVGDDDNLRFETGAKKIPLRVVEQQHSEQWQEILSEELNAKIESSEVLLRAVLFKDQNENSASHLTIAIDHAITDGLSSIQLYSELLTYCQKIAGGEPHSPVPSLEVLPPVDELLPASNQGFRGQINSLLFFLRLKFKQFWHRPETLSFEKTVPIEERRSGVVCRQLDAELTQQLILRCREEETTVQGALGAGMLFAAARKIRAGHKTRVLCRTSIDLRKRLKPAVSDGNMGMLASFLMSFHTLRTNTSFWELARDVRQQLEVGLKRGDIFTPVLNIRKIVESAISRPHKSPTTVSITNVGRVNIPRVYGQFELSQISFIPTQAAFGGVFTAAVTTFEGKMFLNFTFSEPALSQETIETLVDSFMSCMVDASKGNVEFG